MLRKKHISSASSQTLLVTTKNDLDPLLQPPSAHFQPDDLLECSIVLRPNGSVRAPELCVANHSLYDLQGHPENGVYRWQCKNRHSLLCGGLIDTVFSNGRHIADSSSILEHCTACDQQLQPISTWPYDSAALYQCTLKLPADAGHQIELLVDDFSYHQTSMRNHRYEWACNQTPCLGSIATTIVAGRHVVIQNSLHDHINHAKLAEPRNTIVCYLPRTAKCSTSNEASQFDLETSKSKEEASARRKKAVLKKKLHRIRLLEKQKERIAVEKPYKARPHCVKPVINVEEISDPVERERVEKQQRDRIRARELRELQYKNESPAEAIERKKRNALAQRKHRLKEKSTEPKKSYKARRQTLPGHTDSHRFKPLINVEEIEDPVERDRVEKQQRERIRVRKVRELQYQNESPAEAKKRKKRNALAQRKLRLKRGFKGRSAASGCNDDEG